jgi:Ca-activated chloride channel family protein
MANAEAKENPKIGKSVIGETVSLVQSPIVVATWRDVAERLQWTPNYPRWRDLFEYSRDPSLWKEKREPRWGSFKYGHTRPNLSNSGLHAIILEACTGLDKFDNVLPVDLNEKSEKVGEFIRQVEESVVHYGSSTGFLGKEIQRGGRDYLTAAILYENMVIEHNDQAKNKNPRPRLPELVAIYPKEGTFMSDHPVGIVQREDWVTPQQEEAARIYINFLLSPEMQKLAKQSGFRGADGKGLETVFTPDRGVDLNQPKIVLEPPDSITINIMMDLWRKNKRPADLVLAIDTSGSMKEQNRMDKAKEAGVEFINLLSDVDTLTVVGFGMDTSVYIEGVPMNEEGKAKAIRVVNGLVPGNDTALYHALKYSYDFLNTRGLTRRRAIVVLSDGKDSKNVGEMLVDPKNRKKKVSSPTLNQLLDTIRDQGERNTIQIFTFGIEIAPNEAEILTEISTKSRARYNKVNRETIKKVLSDANIF